MFGGKSVDDLEYPVDAHIKVIAVSDPNMPVRLETALIELGLEAPLERSKESKGGKYVSFTISTKVESKEQMNQIDTKLASVEGVKMVL